MNCEYHWKRVLTARQHLEATSLWKRNKVKSCECNAWTRMLPVVWECEQVLWLRWQESDVCLAPSRGPTCTCLCSAPPLKHTAPLCWQIDEAVPRCSRISNIYMYLGGLELGALICLLGCDLSLIILQGKINEMTRTLSYFWKFQRLRSTRLEVRLY